MLSRGLVYHLMLSMTICIQCTDPPLRLYHSNSVGEDAVQHDCLYADIGSFVGLIYEKLAFCLSEPVSEFHIEISDEITNWTFAELRQQNITARHLYDRSAPMDIIEDYEFYLNQSNALDPGKRFFDCTLPRFGPLCQYQFVFDYSDDYSSDFQTFFDIADFIYKQYTEEDMQWTCYDHLQCDYHLEFGCLDWTEICDGYIHCLNGGVDEKSCSELETNECQWDEYRCANGQCIPLNFDSEFRTANEHFYCIDKTDHLLLIDNLYTRSRHGGISYRSDEYTCSNRLLTSSCLKGRHKLISEEFFSRKSSEISSDCWLIFECLFYFLDELCSSIDWDEVYSSIETFCPEVMFVPSVPILFGDISFAYIRNVSLSAIDRNVLQLYLCTENSDYHRYLSWNVHLWINQTRCYRNLTIKLDEIYSSDEKEFLKSDYGNLRRLTVHENWSADFCARSNMYRCQNSSKCISKHRLWDLVFDCPYLDDENTNPILDQNYQTSHFYCSTSKRLIPKIWFDNRICDCGFNQSGQCEDEPTFPSNSSKAIVFEMICDGTIDSDRDESECEQWPCHTLYTHCDGIWNCVNGEDELGCDSDSPLNCSFNSHVCVSLETTELICLSSEQVNDGHVDCLGGVDESKRCRNPSNVQQLKTFHCHDDPWMECLNYSNICDAFPDCFHGDDEQMCSSNASKEFSSYSCSSAYRYRRKDIYQILCEQIGLIKKSRQLDFQIHPDDQQILKKEVEISSKRKSNARRYPIQSSESEYRCHRGLDINVWLNIQTNSTRRACLCPPSYYGNECQYQNERVTVVLNFQTPLDSRRTIFSIVVSLVDESDEGIVHSYEHLTFIHHAFCDLAYYVHLVYSTRPKNQSRSYSIRLDIYEQETLKYRGSYLLPIPFSFLPVHRLAWVIHIPSKYDTLATCSNRRCEHGKCIRYLNHSESETFCQCDRDWSGRACHIRRNCTCSGDSVCIGVSTSNRSVCACPYLQHGPRCLLTEYVCPGNCQNGGTCIPVSDENMGYEYMCLCPKGYHGFRCHKMDYNISLTFAENMRLPEIMVVHLLGKVKTGMQRSTIFKKIPFGKRSVLIHWPLSYRLVFIELFKEDYYFAVLQSDPSPPLTLDRHVSSSSHCPHVQSLVNQTIAQYPVVDRMKFYHFICANYSSTLSCFRDEQQFCLCYDYSHQRLANCLAFDFNNISHCEGDNQCQNGATCFHQDQREEQCQRKIMCQCEPCFFGLSCQFSTNGFSLSLDSILGYHIHPNISFANQSTIIWVSSMVTILFLVIGLANGLLTFLTFKGKPARGVGCGIYLLASSLTVLTLIFLFGCKFWILILSQMSIIRNRRFLLIQCQLIDWMIRCCLYLDQWLNSCVSIERAVCAVEGVCFNKSKSQKTARWVIFVLFVILFVTNVHEPVHRTLIHEEDEENLEERFWCVTQYSSSLESYNTFVILFHFFSPFLLNILSTVILLRQQSKQQLKTIYRTKAFAIVLQERLRKNKHLLLAPIILILLAIPRLILSFLSRCMESHSQSWLFLCGYFISFTPPMLTFVIFILPSKFYKEQLKVSMQKYREMFRRHLHCNQ